MLIQKRSHSYACSIRVYIVKELWIWSGHLRTTGKRQVTSVGSLPSRDALLTSTERQIRLLWCVRGSQMWQKNHHHHPYVVCYISRGGACKISYSMYSILYYMLRRTCQATVRANLNCCARKPLAFIVICLENCKLKKKNEGISNSDRTTN